MVLKEELHQTLSDIGYKDSGIVTIDTTPEKYMAVRYNDLIAPIIKATQEQQKLIQAQDGVIKEQDKINQQQEKTILALLKRVEALEKNK